MHSMSRFLIAIVLVVAISSSPTVAATISFRQGVNGYTQAQDTWLPKANPNTNYGTNPGLGVGRQGAANEEQVLIGYYGIFGNGPGQIPPGSTINTATLNMAITFGFVPLTASVHRMLTPWTDTVATWNSLTNGLDNTPSGEFVPVPGYSGPFGSTVVPVTSIVQAWSNGATNYGFAIRPTSPTGAFAFQSSEIGSVNQRPMLIVDYVSVSVPEPTVAMLAVVPGMIYIGARRRRRGRMGTTGRDGRAIQESRSGSASLCHSL